jgi:hypothetical protein
MDDWGQRFGSSAGDRSSHSLSFCRAKYRFILSIFGGKDMFNLIFQPLPKAKLLRPPTIFAAVTG